MNSLTLHFHIHTGHQVILYSVQYHSGTSMNL